MSRFTKLLFVLLLAVPIAVRSQNYEFASLRGYPQMNTAGWSLAGMAYTGSSPVGDGSPSELILTDLTGNTSGAAVFNTPVDISACQTWVAEFDFRIFGGNGADGIGFFFLSSPPRGYVRGGGIGIPTGNRGLVVALDQYLNGSCYGGPVPKLQIRYLTPTSNYLECPPGPPQPTVGGVTEIRQPIYNRCTIRYDAGNINVSINGVVRLSGFYNIDFAGYFGLSASTGGNNDWHSIKNFSLKTFKPILSAPNAGPDVTVCNNTARTIGVATAPNDPYTYRWTPTTGLDNPNIANPTVIRTNNSGAPQTFSYFLVKDTVGTTPRCAFADEVKVTVLGRAATAGADITVCSNESRNLNLTSQTGYTYRWFPSTGLNNAFTSSPILKIRNTTGVPQVYEYIVTANSSSIGCQDQDTLLVTVLPEAASAGPDKSVCANATTIIGVPSLPNYIYSWSPTTGLVTPGQSQTTVALINPGTSVVRYRFVLSAFSTIGSCTTTDTVWVSVFPSQPPNVGPRVRTLCNNSTSQLGANPQLAFAYRWTPATGLDNPNVSNPTLTGINTGTAPISVWYKLTSTSLFSGCSNADSILVTINPDPLPLAGVDQSICQDGSITLGSTTLPGYFYIWSPDSGLSNANIAQPVLSARLRGTTSISRQYILTSIALGCQTNDTVLVTINPIPANPLPTKQFNVCDGSSVTINTQSQPNHTYSWSPGRLLSDSNSSNPVFAPVLGNQAVVNQSFYLRTKNNQTGCERLDTIKVIISPYLRLRLLDTATCATEPVQLGTMSRTGWLYSWSPKIFLDDSTLMLPTFKYAVAPARDTTFNYIVTARQPSGLCATTDTLKVLVRALPRADAGQDRLELCQGDSTTIGSPAVPGRTYRWQPTTGLDNPRVAQPRVSVASAAPGIINYVLTVRDAHCSNTDTVSVLVKPKPSSLLPNLISVCNGSPTNVANPPLPGYVYRWNTSVGLSDSTIANPVITLDSRKPYDTTYIYTLQISNPTSGCNTSDTMGVVVHPLPVAEAGADISVCPSELGQIGTDSVISYGYLWTPSNGLSSVTVAKPDIILGADFANDQNYTYRVTVTDLATGCTSQDSVVVTLKARPIVSMQRLVRVCIDDTITIGPQNTVPGALYRWSAGIGIQNPGLTQQRIALSSNAPTRNVYYLTVTGGNTCIRFDSVVVILEPKPIKPSIRGRSSFCPGISGVGFRVGNPQPGYTYQWQIVGGTITTTTPNTDSITVAWGAVNPNAQIIVTARSAAGCFSEPMRMNIQLKVILDVDKPIALNGKDSLCLNQAQGQVYFAAPILPFSTYQWNISGNGTILSGQGTNRVVVSWNQVGRGYLWISEQSQTPSDTCLGTSDSLVQDILDVPELLNISKPQYACQNSAQLVSLFTQFVGDASYRWVTPGALVVNDFGFARAVRYNTPGKYLISVTVISQFGCEGTTLQDSIVVEPQPIIAWEDTASVICASRLTGYTYQLTQQPGLFYNWRIRGGAIISANADSSQVVVNWRTNAGIYQIGASGENNKGCGSPSISRSFRLESIGQELFYALVAQAPNGSQPIEITYQTSTGQPTAYLQRRPIFPAADTTFRTIAALANGPNVYQDPSAPMTNAYAYRIVVPTSCGDTVFGTTHQTIYLTANTIADQKDGIQLSWSAYKGWEVGAYMVYRALEGSNDYTLIETVFPTAGESTFSLTGNWGAAGFRQCYRIQATGIRGRQEDSYSNLACLDLANVPIIYNTVTPNQDGKNDQLVLDYLDLYPNNSIKIFNRYGVLVSESKPYRNNWPEVDVRPGTYFMIIDLGNGSAPTKEWIEVLK